jgi:membrane-bound lytic murein transglycosylase D
MGNKTVEEFLNCGAIPDNIFYNLKKRSFWGLLRLTAVVVAIASLASCGSSLGIVKKDSSNPSSITNAISRVFDFGSEKSFFGSNKPGSYPPIPLETNEPRVRKFLREYAYERRDSTRSYLSQATRYLPMVKEQTQKHHLPEELAYLFLLESGANPEARSPANALGMWQFMPATARSYGLRVDSYVDERLDPAKSTTAALTYLKDLYGMFGCWRLALSAYNSGENKLNKVLCKEDANEYEDICSSRMLKRETKEFLPRFQALAIIAKNPERYGFQRIAPKERDEKTELAPIDGSYSLAKLAGILGVSSASMMELNPALVRGVTPSEGAPYSIRVPQGKKDAIIAGVRHLPEESPNNGHVVHLVRKGDSVPGLTKRYGISKEMLAQINPDVNLSRRLKRGQKIMVPRVPAKNKLALKENKNGHKSKPKPPATAKRS